MRAYFFVNSALSGIQKGLQVAHCVAEINEKYRKKGIWPCNLVCPDQKDARCWNTYNDWATDHKTIIVLEGGFHDDLKKICELFLHGVGGKRPGANPSDFPWAHFSEDEETMNGMMTCVGIILPERIYGAAKEVREGNADLGKHGPEDEWWFSPSLKGVEGKIQERYDLSEWSPYTGWEVELIKLLNRPMAR